MGDVVDLEEYAVARAGGRWHVAIERCVACGRLQIAVRPSTAPDWVECGDCHAMAAQVEEWIDAGATRAEAVAIARALIEEIDASARGG